MTGLFPDPLEWLTVIPDHLAGVGGGGPGRVRWMWKTGGQRKIRGRGRDDREQRRVRKLEGNGRRK